MFSSRSFWHVSGGGGSVSWCLSRRVGVLWGRRSEYSVCVPGRGPRIVPATPDLEGGGVGVRTVPEPDATRSQPR